MSRTSLCPNASLTVLVPTAFDHIAAYNPILYQMLIEDVPMVQSFCDMCTIFSCEHLVECFQVLFLKNKKIYIFSCSMKLVINNKCFSCLIVQTLNGIVSPSQNPYWIISFRYVVRFNKIIVLR